MSAVIVSAVILLSELKSVRIFIVILFFPPAGQHKDAFIFYSVHNEGRNVIMDSYLFIYLLNLLCIQNDNYLFMFVNYNAHLLRRINKCINTQQLALNSG